MKKLITAIALIVAGVVIFFALRVLVPVTYDANAFSPHEGTKFWDLPTGSRIGYQFFAGDSSDSKEAIIYLHGGPGAGITKREMETFRKLASHGYDVYLYDQVGCGSSGRLSNIAGYTAQRHIDDLFAIIKVIRKPRVILVGQSWGSILATWFTALHPELVSSLVIAAPAPLQPTRKELAGTTPPDSLQLRGPSYEMSRQGQRVPSIRGKLGLYLARKMNFKLMSDEEADKLATWRTDELNLSMVCDSANAIRAEGTEGYYAHYLTSRSIAGIPDHRHLLRHLQTPVLVMKAQCDNQPWGFTAEYLDVFPQSEFQLIPDAGHNAFIEQQDIYVESISGFLSRR